MVMLGKQTERAALFKQLEFGMTTGSTEECESVTEQNDMTTVCVRTITVQYNQVKSAFPGKLATYENNTCNAKCTHSR